MVDAGFSCGDQQRCLCRIAVDAPVPALLAKLSIVVQSSRLK